MLNIPSYIEDIAYRLVDKFKWIQLLIMCIFRYKMPKMILKIEGKGNGIKTNIVNLVEVAKSLRVPTAYPLKYMGA